MFKIRMVTLLVSVAMLPVTAFAASGPPTFSNPQPVIVTNPPNQGSNTFIVNPGDIGAAVGQAVGTGTPVVLNFLWSISGNPSSPNYTVPTGKRLVIEYVTGLCRGFNQAALGLGIGVPQSPTQGLYLPAVVFTSIPFNATVEQEMSFSVPAKAYVPSGTPLNIVLLNTPAGQGFSYAQCDAVVAYGQLIDSP